MNNTMKIVTIGNEKGGVGKTSLAIELAYGLANKGRGVLFLDTDPQSNATTALGIRQAPGFYDLLVREADWLDVIKVVPNEQWQMAEAKGPLLMVPGNVETRGIPDYVSDVLILRERLEQLVDVVDVVVIDTPPVPSMLHSIVFTATDYFVGVTQAEYFSLSKLQTTLAQIDRLNASHKKHIKVIGIQPNFYRTNTREHRENLEKLQERYPGMVWEPIGNRIPWTEASRAHMPVVKFAPDELAATESKIFVAHVMEVIDGQATTD